MTGAALVVAAWDKILTDWIAARGNATIGGRMNDRMALHLSVIVVLMICIWLGFAIWGWLR